MNIRGNDCLLAMLREQTQKMFMAWTLPENLSAHTLTGIEGMTILLP